MAFRQWAHTDGVRRSGSRWPLAFGRLAALPRLSLLFILRRHPLPCVARGVSRLIPAQLRLATRSFPIATEAGFDVLELPAEISPLRFPPKLVGRAVIFVGIALEKVRSRNVR